MISLLSQSCCWVHLGNFSFYLYFLTLKSPLVNFYSFPFSIEVPYSLTHYFLLIFKHSFYSLFVFMTDTLKSLLAKSNMEANSESLYWLQFSSVQSLSRVQLFVTPWTAARQASLSITNSRSLLKLMSIESVMASNHLILCHPLLPPSIPPSIRVFSNQSVLRIRWPNYWSFSFSISPSNEYSGLIFFRIWRVWSPCSPRDSQESSPTPQFKSVNSSALSFPYGPTLMSIHDYWKNHSFD